MNKKNKFIMEILSCSENEKYFYFNGENQKILSKRNNQSVFVVIQDINRIIK